VLDQVVKRVFEAARVQLAGQVNGQKMQAVIDRFEARLHARVPAMTMPLSSSRARTRASENGVFLQPQRPR
jgi:hypothetical protein